MLKTTNQHTKYWKDRKIDWSKSYLSTWNHPHRSLLVEVLRGIPFHSLWEVGVGGGANLVAIIKNLKGKQLGGCDVNKDAIELCKKTFNHGGIFRVESGEDMLMSDKSVDVILSDMTLIYVAPWDIKKYLKEFRRVARVAIVLCEFHSRSWWKRWLARLTSGYHVHDYKKLLDEAGFYDVHCVQIPPKYWPADNNSQFRHIIVGKIPNHL